MTSNPDTKSNRAAITPGTVWATRAQLATRYSVHPRTIDDWRRAGHLPAFVYGTRLVRFDLEACDLWIARFRRAAKWEKTKGGAL